MGVSEPTRSHLKIEKYWSPDEFQELKEIAMSKGFSHCQSGPLVRSSYHADEQVNRAQARQEALKAERGLG